MKPLTERVVYHSVKGKRPSNQDSVVVGVLADGRSVAAVADGMGGRLAGDVASQRALEVVINRLREGDALAAAVEESNRAVFDESRTNPDLHGMGTTVVAMLQDGDQYEIANVGDSRAYRLAGDGISKVTADHSFTAEAIEAGEMTPEDAVLSPWANALTRAIGTDPEVQVDIYGPFDATESHAILLCSDGFHKPLSDDGILNSVLGCDANGETAEELTEIALRAGSDDNITIALVSFGDRSWMDEAVRARHDLWALEDAPTVEFEKDEDDSRDADSANEEHPGEEASGNEISGEEASGEGDSDDEASSDDVSGGAEPEWTMPDSFDEVDELTFEAEGIIDAGGIGEGISPMHPASDAPPEPEPATSAAVAVTDERPEPAESSQPSALGDPSGRAEKTHTPRRTRGFPIVVPSGFRTMKMRDRKKAVQSAVFIVAVAAAVTLALRFL